MAFRAIWARAKLSNAGNKIIHDPGKFFALRGRNPFQAQAVGIQTELFQHQLQKRNPAPGTVISAQIMAIARMTARDHDAVRAFAERAQNEFRINPGGTHASDHAEVRLDFQA